MEHLLEVKHLEKKFDGLIVSKDINLTVDQGEIIGVIGPNGAGKTTLFAQISGFLKPDSGGIYFRGENIVGLKPHQICERGLTRTFQVVQPFEHLTVIDNVMIGALVRTKGTREAVKEAEKILDFVGMSNKKDLPISSMTLADRKRIEVAKALATAPKLILLDEVMAGLTPTESKETVELIQKINAQGITVVLIEHVISAVVKLAERVIVINHGEKIADGDAKTVFENKEVIRAYFGEGRNVE